MTKITNLSKTPLDFVVGTKDGQPITKAVRPGETADVEVDIESPVVKGRLLSGLISLDARAAAKVAKSMGDAQAPSA